MERMEEDHFTKTFVKVMQKKLWPLFFPDTVYTESKVALQIKFIIFTRSQARSKRVMRHDRQSCQQTIRKYDDRCSDRKPMLPVDLLLVDCCSEVDKLQKASNHNFLTIQQPR